MRSCTFAPRSFPTRTVTGVDAAGELQAAAAVAIAAISTGPANPGAETEGRALATIAAGSGRRHGVQRCFMKRSTWMPVPALSDRQVQRAGVHRRRSAHAHR